MAFIWSQIYKYVNQHRSSIMADPKTGATISYHHPPDKTEGKNTNNEAKLDEFRSTFPLL